MKEIKIKNKKISENHKTYFIADIAANHDGSLKRAKKLIRLASQSGADAAKFQHFKAKTIVSDLGFKKLGKRSHQSKWNKSVYEVYKDASINNSWNKTLAKECKKYGIHFMTSPYDLNYVDSVNKYICAYKIGSGDISWTKIIDKIASKKKPVILATGASSLKDVKRAVKILIKKNKQVVLMQCNTNYTASIENFHYLNLNVLKTYKKLFKNKLIYGLSDHTHGHTSVLASIVLGARVIEKHFTDDNSRTGPDHKFSMNPMTWRKMVDETRNLERSLGNGVKKVEKNEKETFFAQRRCVRANINIKKNQKITKEMLVCLRPINKGAVEPFDIKKIIRKRALRNIKLGEAICWKNIK